MLEEKVRLFVVRWSGVERVRDVVVKFVAIGKRISIVQNLVIISVPCSAPPVIAAPRHYESEFQTHLLLLKIKFGKKDGGYLLYDERMRRSKIEMNTELEEKMRVRHANDCTIKQPIEGVVNDYGSASDVRGSCNTY
ncbi:hypothetical protein VNO77_41720 [Canavalia gladiata]|uniref:Uncharacterized protein n=1 Tax=Canavalia gladiata TaxID=3824 RepID=A0AAN9K0B6_CANGL